MAALRASTRGELFRLDNLNPDPLAETASSGPPGRRRGAWGGRRRPRPGQLAPDPRPQYGIPFCLQHLARWPECFIAAEAPGGELVGYGECGRPRGTGL
ncbi:N-alpha-acetyltransferase 20 [Nyctibius grandis]|uniref:N-alpha-acetyltransferase 20 n=1 Tax=Nyctibius grandis TaxID=48427 RepID=UPI0035BBFB70